MTAFDSSSHPNKRDQTVSSPFVSVIIPVFNDLDGVRRCLVALDAQTYPKTAYEVIVVDNNSTEDIASVVNHFDRASVIHESRRGSYAARNKGIAIAQGSILAFTDADCTPAANWIEQGVKYLSETPNCGLAAGKIELFFKNPTCATAVEEYDRIHFLRQEHYIKNLHFGATANLFTYKAVFDRIGVFNAELKSGGDQEWGKRVFSAGYTQIYAADACVAHPARYELSELKRKLVRVTEGHYNLKRQEQAFHATLLKEILIDMAPSVKDIKDVAKALLNPNLRGVPQKVALIHVILTLKYAKAWKKVQLYSTEWVNDKRLGADKGTCQH